MHLRYDHVARTAYHDTDLLYTLVLTVDGIYMIYMDGSDATTDADGWTPQILTQLALAEHCAFVRYNEVKSVVARAREADHALFMKTAAGNFSFTLLHSSADDVYQLLQAITERKQA